MKNAMILATLIAAIATFFIGVAVRNKVLKFPLGALPPVLANAFIIPIIFILVPEASDQTYLINVLSVGAGEFLSVFIFGLFLYVLLIKLRSAEKTGKIFIICGNLKKVFLSGVGLFRVHKKM